MPHVLHTLINQLIITLDLLYDLTKDHDSIWLIISDIIDELKQVEHHTHDTGITLMTRQPS